jgi:hypothetical protein
MTVHNRSQCTSFLRDIGHGTDRDRRIADKIRSAHEKI